MSMPLVSAWVPCVPSPPPPASVSKPVDRMKLVRVAPGPTALGLAKASPSGKFPADEDWKDGRL